MKRRKYEGQDLDSVGEVVDAMNRLEGWCEALQAEVEVINKRLAKKKPKKEANKEAKKKGFVMKQTLLSIAAISVILTMFVVVAQAAYVRDDISYEIAANPELLSNYLRDVISSNVGWRFVPQTSAPAGADLAEGVVYYNDTSNALFVSTDGATFTQLTTAAGNSLDTAYDAGNGITVDGDAVTLTVGASDNNSALVLTHNETSNNNDAMTIAVAGTGDAIQISPGATTGGAINWISVASGTTSGLIMDAATNNWSGANDVGLVHINSDAALAHAGSSLLQVVHATTQPASAAEGFLARFVSTGTARTNGSAVEIEVPATQPALAINGITAISGQDNPGASLVQVTGIDTTGNSDTMTITHSGSGDALQIAPQETDSGGINLVAVASGTVPLMILDGSTNNIDLADNKGQLLIQCDDPYIHTGAAGLVITDSSTPIASAEGFLARFVHSGTARTNAYAVEIEVPATQPALAVNGITAITGQDNPGASLVQITGIDTTGNSDTVTITHSGSGDGLQISPQETDSRAMSVTALAASTVSNVIIDAATNNWSGADNVGLLHINSDSALAHAGASLLQVAHATGQPVASAEGFLARFVSTGTARTNGYAVEIEVPATQPAFLSNGIVAISGQDAAGGAILQVTGVGATGDADAVTITTTGAGDCLQISPGEADTVGIRNIALAASTVSNVVVDAATNNWSGADNVGLVHINSDAALAHAGASLLQVAHATGQPVASAEGFLARFVSTGTARTDGYAVEIEVPATQPALAINGITAITGQDSAGAALVQITGNDATGNADTMTINSEGTGDALQITCDDADSVALNLIAAASQTTSLAKFDGATGSWLGANNVGMLHLTNDGALAHVNSSLLYIANTGVPQNDSRGSSLRIVDTGNAAAGTAGYAVYVSATDATVEAMYIDDGDVLVDEVVYAEKGMQNAIGETLTANSDSGAASTIDEGVSIVNVTGVTVGVNDWIVLPASTIGRKVTVFCNAGSAFEIRTPAASNDTINNVDSDGTQEFAAVDGSVYVFTCHTATGWIGVGYTNLGAHAAAVVPD